MEEAEDLPASALLVPSRREIWLNSTERDLSLGADRSLEREANVFAAELLMPESAVCNAFSQKRSLHCIARMFCVSPQAMHWRLYNFGLIVVPPVEPRPITEALRRQAAEGGRGDD